MNIRVEIGTLEQQSIIKKELSLIENVCSLFDPPLPLLEVIVPFDFDATINKMQERSSFKSERMCGIVAAKIINQEDGSVIVLSPLLYTETNDIQTRTVFYLHELCHVYNSRRFPHLLESSNIAPQYFINLYIMYDEYWADRKAFALADDFFPEKSDIFKTHIRNGMEDFMHVLSDDSTSHDTIKSEISSFRGHGDIMCFLNAIDGILDGIMKAIAHSFAYIDHFQQFRDQEAAFRTSKFVNDRTKQLIGFIRSKYDENSVDLLEGIILMEKFISNFGIRFEVLSSGEVYCNVLDILN